MTTAITTTIPTGTDKYFCTRWARGAGESGEDTPGHRQPGRTGAYAAARVLSYSGASRLSSWTGGGGTAYADGESPNFM